MHKHFCERGKRLHALFLVRFVAEGSQMLDIIYTMAMLYLANSLDILGDVVDSTVGTLE